MGLFVNDLYAAAPVGIYGKDDRQDYFQITDPRIREIARSTVAIMFKNELVELPNGDFVKSKPHTLVAEGLCSDARFSSQVTYGHCSGSLIDKDVVLTAAHCFSMDDTSTSFKKMYVVFDLLLHTPSQTQISIKRKNVFEIKEILYYDLYNNGMKVDLSTVRLNRIVNRVPLKLNTRFDYSFGKSIFMLGYPMGLPLKYTNNATISKVDIPGNSFHNNLDAFSANSGSSIFDARSKEIIGVLARGASNNFLSTAKGCYDWGIGTNPMTEEGMLLWNLPTP